MCFIKLVQRFELELLYTNCRALNDTFGECGRPKVGWQIDTSGHSREMADILALSGYDGLFLGRIDYQDKERRMKDKEMEMIWRGSDDIGIVFIFIILITNSSI